MPLPSSRVQTQMRGSTAGVRRPITRLKEDVGMKVPFKDICPMHWHPSHATKSAASPSCCLWSINNKLLTSFTANAANNTPVRLREGGWQIHNSPVNRFSHASQQILPPLRACSPPASRANYELITEPAVGLLSPQESSAMYGDHEGGE